MIREVSPLTVPGTLRANKPIPKFRTSRCGDRIRPKPKNDLSRPLYASLSYAHTQYRKAIEFDSRIPRRPNK